MALTELFPGLGRCFQVWGSAGGAIQCWGTKLWRKCIFTDLPITALYLGHRTHPGVWGSISTKDYVFPWWTFSCVFQTCKFIVGWTSDSKWQRSWIKLNYGGSPWSCPGLVLGLVKAYLSLPFLLGMPPALGWDLSGASVESLGCSPGSRNCPSNV